VLVIIVRMIVIWKEAWQCGHLYESLLVCDYFYNWL